VIRAHVIPASMAFGVDIGIVQHHEGEELPGARQIMRLLPLGTGDDQRLVVAWEPIAPGSLAPPTLSLGDDEAIALMTALVAHYQGVDDQRMLRRDYDAERGRVDKLVDALVGIAQQRAEA
jgi:hypothetical protein